MPPAARRTIVLVVSVVAIGAVVWWVSKQDEPQLPNSLGRWSLVVAALGAYASSLVLRGWRWHRIMVLAHIPHRRADAYWLTIVGFGGNNVIPARGGELLRIGLLSARTTARRREILGSIVAERLLDVAVLAALFAVLTLVGAASAPTGSVPALVAVAVLLIGAGALAAYLALRRRGRFETFAARVRPVARASKVFAHREGIPVALQSVVVWLLEGATLLFVGLALGLQLQFLEAALITVTAALFAAVPAGPGYAGTYDAGVLLGVHAVGIGGAAAVSFLLLARFVAFVPVTIVGGIVLVTRYGGLRRARAIKGEQGPQFGGLPERQPPLRTGAPR